MHAAEITTLRGDVHALDAIAELDAAAFDGMLFAQVMEARARERHDRLLEYMRARFERIDRRFTGLERRVRRLEEN